MELLIVIGNLGSDAQFKNENGSEFVKFNVAETRRWKGQDNVDHEETIWNSCIMNGRQEKLLPYLVKGTKVCVIGRASTRVYSSPKERRMVAGININVDRVELIGTQPDAVPRRIVTQDGELVNVAKFFAIDPSIAEKNGAKKGVPAIFYDEKGGSYLVDANGLVAPQKTPENSTEETTEATNREQQ